jgi:hypothetical protein
MQDYLLKCPARKAGVRHINAAPCGALIQGMESLPLDRALSECRQSGVSPQDRLDSAIRETQAIPEEARNYALERWAADLEDWMGKTSEIKEFASLFAAFRSISLYAHAARSYDDIFYLYETGHKKDGDFAARFREHLRFVLAQLRRIQERFSKG